MFIAIAIRHATRLGNRLSAGDERALTELLDAQGSRLARCLLRKYTGRLTPHDVEDILQVAALQLWDKRTQFDETKGAVETWFAKIVANATSDWLRSKRRLKEVYLGDGNLSQLARASGDGTNESHEFKAWQAREEFDSLADEAGLSQLERRFLLGDRTDGLKPGSRRSRRSRLVTKLRAAARRLGRDLFCPRIRDQPNVGQAKANSVKGKEPHGFSKNLCSAWPLAGV